MLHFKSAKSHEVAPFVHEYFSSNVYFKSNVVLIKEQWDDNIQMVGKYTRFHMYKMGIIETQECVSSRIEAVPLRKYNHSYGTLVVIVGNTIADNIITLPGSAKVIDSAGILTISRNDFVKIVFVSNAMYISMSSRVQKYMPNTFLDRNYYGIYKRHGKVTRLLATCPIPLQQLKCIGCSEIIDDVIIWMIDTRPIHLKRCNKGRMDNVEPHCVINNYPDPRYVLLARALIANDIKAYGDRIECGNFVIFKSHDELKVYNELHKYEGKTIVFDANGVYNDRIYEFKTSIKLLYFRIDAIMF